MGIKRQHYAGGTLGWALAEYRQSPAYKGLRPSSRKTYEAAFNRLHKYRNQPLDGLHRRHVLKIRDDLSDTPALANVVLCALQSLCRFALDRDMIDTNPTQGVERLPIGTWRRWTDAELGVFYTQADEPLRRAFILALYTGQRCSDLAKALWSDIEDGGIKVAQQKTGRKLWMPLHPTLAAHLTAWKKDAATVTILAAGTGRPWTAQYLSVYFSNEVKRLKLKGCTLHGLRKTAGAKLAEAGCSTKQIQAILGHTTLGEIERYTEEADQRRLAKAAMKRFTGPALKMICNPLKSHAV